MEFLFSLENVWKDPASESLHCLGRTATSFSLISLSCDTTSLLPSQGHSLVSAAQDRRAIHTCETMCNTQLHFNITCTSPGFATMLVQASLRSSSRKKSWVESQSRVLLDERIHLQVLSCLHRLHHFLLLHLHLLLPHHSGEHQGQLLRHAWAPLGNGNGEFVLLVRASAEQPQEELVVGGKDWLKRQGGDLYLGRSGWRRPRSNYPPDNLRLYLVLTTDHSWRIPL